MKKQRVKVISFALFLAMTMVCLPAAGAATVPEPQAEPQTEAQAETKTETEKPPVDTWETDPALKEKWGIEIASIRLTANDHMIDYRYRVLDAAKATDLFKRQIKPRLIHQETEKVLAVPDTAKLGPLRNSNIPQEGRIYWMFFGNAGNLVKPGDKVTIVIGDFRAEDLIVK